MKTLHFRQKTEADGLLRLDIPIGKADTECEIVVVVEPAIGPKEWIPGFWDILAKGWRGEPLSRSPQGEPEKRVKVEDWLEP